MHSIHIGTVMTIPNLKYEKTSLVLEYFCQHLSFTSNLSAMAVNRQSIQLARENWGMEHPIIHDVWQRSWKATCVKKGIWYTRPMFFRLPANLNTPCFFSERSAGILGVLVVWCHLWGLMFQAGCGSLLQDFSSIERFRGKIMYPNFFGSSWSNYLCIFLSFFFHLWLKGLPRAPQDMRRAEGWPGGHPVPAMLGSLQPVGGPQNQPLNTRSLLFSLLKDSLVS